MTAPDQLIVWLADQPVATLRQARGGRLELAYPPELAERLGIGALCLSVALPVRPAPYTGDPVRWWVEGLLPEGETRTLLEEQFGVRRGDGFGLVCAIGRDCAGAVAFLPDQETPPASGPLHPLAGAEIEAAIAELPQHPLGADFDVPVSLAGLQAKLLLHRTTDGWARPAPGVPSTHILKPDPFEHHGLIAAEALCLTAAGLAGLDVAQVELVRIADRDVLIVGRFDRRSDPDGRVVRIHQEDGCQALGIDPAGRGKYQQMGRKLPSYEGLARVLGDHAVDPRAEWARLASAMTLSIAVGNADAHARNYAFLFASGTLRLAPAYDVAPTVEFAKSVRAGLWVGGQDLIEKVSFHHLALEAKSWGLPGPAAAETVLTTLDALADALPRAAERFPGVPAPVVDRIIRRTQRLRRQQGSQ